MHTTTEHLYKIGIIPVVSIERVADAVPLARALCAGGLPAVEVTFRTPAAAAAIAAIAQQVPAIFICAGTVLTPLQAQEAALAGAKALISPGLNPAVVAAAQSLHLPIYPGCATPTEVEAAMALGLTELKLFPAEVVGGVAMLKALAGPYSTLRFMPTGGIHLQNVSAYLSQKNVIACGGSWICPDTLLANKDFAAITTLAREAALLVQHLRGCAQ